MKDIMKSVQINNPDLVELLDDFKDMWWDKRENLTDYIPLVGPDDNRDEWISEEHKNKIMEMGSSHDGFPLHLRAHNFKGDAYRDPEIFTKFTHLNNEIQTLLGTKGNALATIYPPGGFISWHNNANASAYNLIFTWSENGDGYWKHIDPYTDEEVHVQDVPGWQCKAFYFGSYEDSPEDIVYHMASTDCWRMTLSYIFDRRHKDYWEEVISEIEYDE